MRTPIPVVFAEFFGGIGLVRPGLEQAGMVCAFAHKINPAKGIIHTTY